MDLLKSALVKIPAADDVKAIHDAILECGLYPHTQWMLNEFPPELYKHCGKGIGLWQYPCQFAPYLAALARRIGRVDCLNYAEIGVAAGGTFMFTSEFLQRFCVMQGGQFKGYAVDIARPSGVYSGTLERYVESLGSNTKFVHGNCDDLVKELDADGVGMLDVLFIDGDHTYEGVTTDFTALRDRAKIIVFHDIVNQVCPGVCRIWRELKASGEWHCEEFTDQYATVNGSYLGIGVCVKSYSCR